MHTVQIEHPVRDFDKWKVAFDCDPACREASGVLRYRIFRPVDDPQFVCVEGTVMTGPRVRIVDCVERHEY